MEHITIKPIGEVEGETMDIRLVKAMEIIVRYI